VKGVTLLQGPPTFKTFELAHRIETGEHWFEVGVGSSFNGLYYEFTPASFSSSPNHADLVRHLKQARAAWLIPVIEKLSKRQIALTADQMRELFDRKHRKARIWPWA